MNKDWVIPTTSSSSTAQSFQFQPIMDPVLSGVERRDILIMGRAMLIQNKEHCSRELAQLKALIAWEALDDEAILCV